ncbi:hypothetical protein [Flavobacterium granuli]|uniref:Uncharacterized protein n=1 Tax=Flavobacterium granuli TaxID=280093 RepID=A0ABU1RX32_9FLAO|nr:hypothetical protein [Flavobacterium granuli]MDR6843333.1 hypothetical protein [Flavobacterium granuli]
MILHYDFYKGLWLINSELTIDYFLESIGVEKGYALDMFTRMYNCIFSELIDIEEEYLKYYSFEYENFEVYLYKKYNLEKKDIKKVLKKMSKFPHCKIYKKDDYSYGDYTIPQFITSETMHKRINKILKEKL